MKADLYALAAIALWSVLALLGVELTHVPPFLLTGIALLIGSPVSYKCRKSPAKTLARLVCCRPSPTIQAMSGSAQDGMSQAAAGEGSAIPMLRSRS